MINIIITDDSPTSRELLSHILASDPELRVVNTVSNGEEAAAAVLRCNPDIVIMDVHMPKVDGFEATRRIMRDHPVPIVIVSGTLEDEVSATFRALEAGALAFIRQPPAPGHPEYAGAAAELIRTVKTMAEVKVVRRRDKKQRNTNTVKDINTRRTSADIGVIAIGASTGGPAVLQDILSAIAPNLQVPVVIVQHIASGFMQGLAQWLNQSCGVPVHIATDGETALPAHVYIAPEDRHMGIDGNGRIRLNDGPPDHGLRPSVSHLFRSVAGAFGPRAAGVLLTGMGRDGAQELKLMRDGGAVTVAQDEATSIVHGMPGAAIKLDGAAHVMPPAKIAGLLNHLMSRNVQLR